MNVLEKIKSELKENPNNFIIVNKWNKRIYKKYEFELFNYSEDLIEKEIQKRTENFFTDFVDVKDAATGV